MTKAGTPAVVRSDFIHIVNRGKDEDEVLVTFYEPTHPQMWLGSCDPDVRSPDLVYPERGRARCSLRLYKHQEGDYETQVWSGVSELGQCDRDGDPSMITAMRIDKHSVQIWERGLDEQYNQTWGTEAPIQYEPATAPWPKPVAVVDKPPTPTEQLASFIVGPYANTAQVDHRDFFPTAYTTCPVEITGRALPEGVHLLATMSWPSDVDRATVEPRHYLFTVSPQGELLELGLTPVRGSDSCAPLLPGSVAQLPAHQVEWDQACTMHVARKDDATYVGKTIAPCPVAPGTTGYLELEATFRDGAFDFWPRWYDETGRQVGGPLKGPIEFRREGSP